jgi:hypothetical protein
MLIFNATLDKIEDASRQTPLRQMVQICDIYRPVDLHPAHSRRHRLKTLDFIA